MDASLSAQFIDLWEQALVQARLLVLPSRLYQVGILLFCILVAWGLKLWLEPRFTDWLRTLEGRPKWQLRVLLMIRQRLGLIIFAILVSAAAQIMAEISPFPSRRYMLELAGAISVALLAVGFAARFIHNATLRRLVTWALWVFVVLYYTGLLGNVVMFLLSDEASYVTGAEIVVDGALIAG